LESICRASLPLPGPLREPRRREMFAVTTLVDEVALQRGDLLIEQVVGLVDQADHRVGDHRRVDMAQPCGISRGIGRIGRICPIHRLRPVLSPGGPHRLRFAVVLVPQALAALTQEVLVVQQKLVEAGPGDVDQTQLSLRGGCRRPAALGNVLPSAARRLYHLIDGP